MSSDAKDNSEDPPEAEDPNDEPPTTALKYPVKRKLPSHNGNQYAAGQSGGWSRSRFKQEFIREAMIAARAGMTEVEIADMFDISVQGFNLWKYQFPALVEALKEGKEIWDSRVEASMAQAAIGYSHKAEQIFMTKDGTIVRAPYIKHYPPNVRAGAIWLSNRKPREWSKAGVDDSSNVTVNVQVNTVRETIEGKLAELAARNGPARIPGQSDS